MTSHVTSLDLSSSICEMGTLSQLILEGPRGSEVWGVCDPRTVQNVLGVTGVTGDKMGGGVGLPSATHKARPQNAIQEP